MRITAERLVNPESEPEDAEAAAVPDPVLRPKLALWMWERGLDLRAAGRLFGCSHGQIDILCRPFDDPARRRPKEDLLARIVRITQGAVTAEDFYPPALRAHPDREVQPTRATPDDPRAGDATVLRHGRAL